MILRFSTLAACAVATTGAAFAQANDDCAGAIALTSGTSEAFDTTAATAGTIFACAAGGGPDLWYTYTTTAAGAAVTVETCGSTYDTAIEIFDGSCAAPNLIQCNDDSCGLQSSASATAGPAGTTFLIRVGGFNGATGTGTILATETADPCATPDMFEPNIDCTTATPLGDGAYPGLNVETADNDYYEIGLDNGATLTADIFFIDDDGDVDLYLWDPLVACDTNVAGQGTGTGALAVGFSASDDESISYTNTSGGPQTLIVEVDMFTTGACNTYELVLSGTNGMGGGGLGTNYCMAEPNSTGMTGVMSATGSRVVANNNVTLMAENLPNQAFGFFLASLDQGFVPNPGGSSGNLCLGGAIGRYVGAGEIQNTGAGSTFSLTIDLTNVPQPTGFVQVMAGETWNFQSWHRDADSMGVPTSNFTDGYSVNFI